MPNERQSQGEQRFCSGALHYASVLVSGSQRSAISALCLPVCHLTTSSFQTYTKTMLLLCITYPLKAGTPLGWRQSWCCRGHVGQTLPADSESSRIKLLGLLTLQTVVSEYLVAQNNSFQFTHRAPDHNNSCLRTTTQQVLLLSPLIMNICMKKTNVWTLFCYWAAHVVKVFECFHNKRHIFLVQVKAMYFTINWKQ